MRRLELKDGKLIEGTPRRSALAVPEDRDLVADPVELDGVETISLHFGTFKDGRAFTQARVLRQTGFGGDICAGGKLFRDQLAFAVACGFSSFEIETTEPLEDLQLSISRYAQGYREARGMAALERPL